MNRLLMWSMIAALSAPLAMPQGSQTVTVPFRDPARPRKLIVETLNGSITVKGYNGNDAVFDVSSRDATFRGGTPPAGLHRIGDNASDWEITEENNVIHASAGIGRSSSVTVQVPVQTSVSLTTVNGGHVTIDNISGEIEVDATNGGVTITNATGSVVAHSVNGKVAVELTKVTPDKPMSFSTLNGNIDVTLPADVKANVKMKSDQGNMYTDFDIKVDPANRPPLVEDNRGKYKVRLDRTTYGTINGGGPEIQFTSFNGNIYIRKK
jgi:DUF4097 and DUF4098 domain-containing protein YvlB